MISVIIATLNRAEALRSISLPSLARQNRGDFEVIVWDASDGGDSKIVCESFSRKFEARNIQLRYFKAARKGLASQRNDSTDHALGSVLFFIDDDCEVSVDAVHSISVCFDSFPWLNGVGVPMLNKTPASGKSSVMRFATLLFGMKNNQLHRVINKHGGLSLPIKDLPGPAEWLSGGSMSFRKMVFERVRFDERLEIFGGYALGEDYDFSYRVMLEFGQPHLISNGGYVVHHAAAGDRITGIERMAAHFFNAELIRGNFKKYGRRFNPVRVAWGHLGTFLYLLKSGAKPMDIISGIRLARAKLKLRDQT
ncbi:MAG: glycosyltransferase [Synergistaceae bacterium]|nr:glycosyltransferase [Synergistaceae bacterium]